MRGDKFEKVVSLAKRRGFIYPSSQIYGGISGFWDYGPLGIELKNSIKREWWRSMVLSREDVVGIDAAIVMNPEVWEASGHTQAFADPLVECRRCHKRFRKDNFEAYWEDFRKRVPKGVASSGGAYEGIYHCSDGQPHKDLTEEKKFNLLVEVFLGVTEPKQKAYLRGEITQGVFVNFKNVLDSTNMKIPFGIAQIGKAFRNEITPGNFTYRSREFEQMELEYFIRPDDKEAKRIFEKWKEERLSWYISLGMDKKKLRFREHAADERAHYARAAEDIEYEAPFGWSEFEGIHDRGDWDLSRHKLTYKDQDTRREYTPWVIETSGGVDRSVLFFLLDAYAEDGDRVILKLHPKLAPIKVAVFPLVANKPNLVKKARSVYELLTKSYELGGLVAFDDRGNIGKRYFAQDEIGTPWCVTIDYQTLEDGTVTVRDRDTTRQERVSIENLFHYFETRLEGP